MLFRSMAKLVHVVELDVLISLAIASEYFEGPKSRPIVLDSSSPDEVPCFSAKSLGHPVLRSDPLGKGTFVPNEIMIGGSGHASFILLTGPNMGGKSTLLHQVCLAVILARVIFLWFLLGNSEFYYLVVFTLKVLFRRSRCPCRQF